MIKATKEAKLLWKVYAEAQLERCKEGVLHWQTEIDTMEREITGLSFDGSCEDVQKARTLGYEIEFAMGRVFYCEPKVKRDIIP